MFITELEFFKAHQDELVEKYNGKVLVLIGQSVVGVFDSYLQAYLEAQKEHPLGTFMLQLCEPGEDAYTVTITTPGLFSPA